MLAGCAIHHVTPYVPDAANTPQTADAVEASTGCAEADTPEAAAICATPALRAANRAMVQALQAGLRRAPLFGRDALLASQRAWLAALPHVCGLPASDSAMGAAQICLANSLAQRRAALEAAPVSPPPPSTALTQYVSLQSASGAARQPDPVLCQALARGAAAALRDQGSLDPSAMGAAELAGTHGPAGATALGHTIGVDAYDANAYGLFQHRGRTVSLDGAPLITPISLTGLVRGVSSANEGGRFSAFASQTGDYGSLDVFAMNGRLLVLAADPWGSTTPASPGEAAHAGVWDISTGHPAPACLFDTYIRPAEPGPFEADTKLAGLRAALAGLRDAALPSIGATATRDQAPLAQDTLFILFNMPLVAVQQAGGAWTPWLRHRHDAVLDALFAWGQADPAHKAAFDQIFVLLRPAATELVRTYQVAQGLTGSEATQAAGLAIMEMLYQSVSTIAPGLGADLEAPASAAGTRPRYAILANPRS